MSCAIEQLVVSARKALFAMYARCRQLHITDPRLRCQLFDALVRPILSYACEIWVPLGCKVAMQKLEQVHLGFLKSLLGVPVCTASKLVYAEFARAPLKHYCWKQCLRYKERMHAMDTNRLCKVAFLMACRNNSAWHRGIEARLQKLSTPPAPPDEDFNASTAITASADMDTTWIMQPDPESSLQQTYYSYKQHYRMEPYIYEAKNTHLRKILARFRTGTHWLQVRSGRHRGIAREHRLCHCGSNVVEDELHAIFDCPLYVPIREKFADLFEGTSNLYTFLCRNSAHRVALFLNECKAARMPQ